MHEFEVKSAPCQINEGENANVSANVESSRFSHSTGKYTIRLIDTANLRV